MPIIPVAAGLLLATAVAVVIIGLRGGKQSSADSKQPGPSKPTDADRAPFLTRLLSVAGINHKLQQSLLAAGLLVRPSEFAALCMGLAAAGFGGLFLFKHSITYALLAAIAGAIGPLAWVKFRIGNRQQKCLRQLPEALELIATALRSGYSFARAMELVSQQMEPPIADEARRIVDELAVGISLDQALEHFAARQAHYDVKLFVAAVQIQTRIGGNLAEMLIKTAAMIRQRAQLASEIAALTAEGRMSAGILAALPVFLAIAVNYLSPGYLRPLVEDPLGRYMCIAGVVLMASGLATIKRLITVEL